MVLTSLAVISSTNYQLKASEKLRDSVAAPGVRAPETYCLSGTPQA
jgi:hypothetical protein